MRGHVGVGYGGRELSEELYGVFQSEVVGGDIVFFWSMCWFCGVSSGDWSVGCL